MFLNDKTYKTAQKIKFYLDFIYFEIGHIKYQ